MSNANNKNGFTLIEVLTVVILLGILSALAYSSLNDLIQTNKSKEIAREMTTFIERSIANGKTRKKPVEISITGNTISAKIESETISQTFAGSFTLNTANKPSVCTNYFPSNKFLTSANDAGTHNVFSDVSPGCFIVCNSGGSYCGGSVKTAEKNTFTAYIKKRSCNAGNCWGELL